MIPSSGAMQSSRQTPSTSCPWFSTSSSAVLFVLLCLLSARAHDLAKDFSGAKASPAALVPPQFPARKAASSTLVDSVPVQRITAPPSSALSEDAGLMAVEQTGKAKVVKRSAAGRQSTSATGSKITAANRTHQRNRHGGGSSRQSPKYESANDSEKRANRGGSSDSSSVDAYPTTSAVVVSRLHHLPHHQQQQQHGRPSSGHHQEDDTEEDEEDDEDEDADEDDEEDDDGAFPMAAGGSRSVPSLLAFASSRTKGPRDKMLKSSKDALIVTKKSYLKKDWCKTEPLIQKVREAGCITRTIVNRFCYGQCNSFYIPKNAKMDIESTAFKSCSFCKPKRFRWITITLHCPGRNPPYKRKRIQRIKKCKCISEILQ